MDPEVAAAAQAGHWSDPCEALMHNIGTAIRGGRQQPSAPPARRKGDVLIQLVRNFSTDRRRGLPP